MKTWRVYPTLVFRVYCPWCKKTVAADLGDTGTIVRGFDYEADVMAKHKDGREAHAWVLNLKEIKTLQKALSLMLDQKKGHQRHSIKTAVSGGENPG